jgi:hypothetical protein
LMSRISYRRNKWRNVIDARCLDCGESVELKYHELRVSLGRSWPHICSGFELDGQEIKA